LPITTIRVVGGADPLETEGLVFQTVYMSHVRAGREAELPIVSVRPIRVELSKAVTIVRPGSHKAL
jgi:hypothetical protein